MYGDRWLTVYGFFVDIVLCEHRLCTLFSPRFILGVPDSQIFLRWLLRFSREGLIQILSDIETLPSNQILENAEM
jgi:hypothetical protein